MKELSPANEERRLVGVGVYDDVGVGDGVDVGVGFGVGVGVSVDVGVGNGVGGSRRFGEDRVGFNG